MHATMRPFDTLRSAAQYVRRFRNHTFVVKLGGELLDDPALCRSVCAQLALLWSFSIPLVIVHGGGIGLDNLCKRLGLPIEKVAGRRITPPEVLQAAQMAFKGQSQMDFLGALEAEGLPAVGLSGLDGGILKAQKRPPVAVDGQVVDFGLVGDVTAVDVSLLKHLIDGGYVPVVAPFSVDESGQVLNTNADTVATEIAIALKAEKLFFLLKVPGLLSDPANPHSLVPFADLGRLAELEQGGAIKDGMRPKISATRKALALGVASVHFVSGVLPDALLTEVFTNEGSGTMITAAAGNP
jgi:acetylglutamate kinase